MCVCVCVCCTVCGATAVPPGLEASYGRAASCFTACACGLACRTSRGSVVGEVGLNSDLLLFCVRHFLFADSLVLLQLRTQQPMFRRSNGPTITRSSPRATTYVFTVPATLFLFRYTCFGRGASVHSPVLVPKLPVKKKEYLKFSVVQELYCDFCCALSLRATF